MKTETEKNHEAFNSAAIRVVDIWKRKARGEWLETEFCQAIAELELASYAYLKLNLKK